MKSIPACWHAIRRWRAVHVPEGAPLPGPASEAAVRRIEYDFDRSLRPPLKQSLRVHDGSGRVIVFPWGFRMLSAAEIRYWTDLWRRLLPDCHEDERFASKHAIQDSWWHPRWVPFTGNGEGMHHFVDLAPGPGGEVGQVIEVSHVKGPLRVVAPSFARWLRSFVRDLEAGAYRYDQVLGLLLPSDD